MKSSELNAEEIQFKLNYAAKRGTARKPIIKDEKWIWRESISILNQKLQLYKKNIHAYNEQRAVDSLGDTSQYDGVNISPEEERKVDSVVKTAMKVCQDIETVREKRNIDFHSRRDMFSREWKQMENIMRQEGVEAIEIPHKD